jgi:hypothetical protein
MKFSTTKKATSAILTALILSACGGGSDTAPTGGNNNGGNTSTPTVVSLGGVAVKGALDNATAVACIASSTACTTAGLDTVESTLGYIGSDITSNGGQYQITLPISAHGKPVLVRIIADENTTMTCDLSAGCENIDVSGLELKTIAFVEPQGANKGNVPVTANANTLSTLATDTMVQLSGSAGFDEITTQANFTKQTTVASDAIERILGLSIDSNGEDVNLFDLLIPTANSTLGNVVDQVNVSADTIANLALINASFGALGNGDTIGFVDAFASISQSISLAVDSTQESNSDRLTAINNLLVTINTEISANYTELQADVDAIIQNVPIIKDQIDQGELDDIADGVDKGEVSETGTTGSTGGLAGN